MLLTLFKTVDGSNVINKTLTDPTDFTIFLKGDTNIVDPTLLMVSLTGIDYNDFNYAYIPELKRYYFINSISAVSASLFRIDLQCDVLETYKAEIMGSVARIKRNLKSGDFINTTIDFSNITTIEKFNSDIEWVEGNSIIVSTVGV